MTSEEEIVKCAACGFESSNVHRFFKLHEVKRDEYWLAFGVKVIEAVPGLFPPYLNFNIELFVCPTCGTIRLRQGMKATN